MVLSKVTCIGTKCWRFRPPASDGMVSHFIESKGGKQGQRNVTCLYAALVSLSFYCHMYHHSAANIVSAESPCQNHFFLIICFIIKKNTLTLQIHLSIFVENALMNLFYAYNYILINIINYEKNPNLCNAVTASCLYVCERSGFDTA